MEVIKKYFSDLNEDQLKRFEQLGPLVEEWNKKINLISRKDTENLYTHHILHSLSIFRFIQFSPLSSVLDLGTGGGFPGIPLAIAMPDVKFTLIDARAKKIMAVENICAELGIENVRAMHSRVEDLEGKYDFVVSRAVASLDQLCRWSQRLISQEEFNPLPNGLICLKGGDLKKEVKSMNKRFYLEKKPLSTWFSEEYFNEKYLLYLQL
ncbi:MAG: 16S rRNA (guanine(527)-N(7))-methyltransferase RsmG [Saprospirales bacterium]|nr:MAG: 16S rRNA (guanine(527)-N(7))-methyltransferase RsmG [Saprospirales bacterium]